MKALSKTARNALMTKSGAVNKNIINAIKGCRIDGNKIYPCSWKRSGRHVNLTDHTYTITSVLRLGRYKFETGNDAPQGGKEGNFIKCSNTAINFVILLTK